MKKSILIFILVVASSYGFCCVSQAESGSENTLYNTMHIKQMAKRNFTNNGRTKYIYVKHHSKFVSSVPSIAGNCSWPSLTSNTVWDRIQRKNDKKMPYCNTLEIGAVHLEKNNNIRELNIAVDIKNQGTRPPTGTGQKISIAPVYVDGNKTIRHLKKTNIAVHSNRKLHY